MKPSQTSVHIDWYSVLGEDLAGLAQSELVDLTASLEEHSPRCVRLQGDCQPESMPMRLQPVPWYQRGYWLTDQQVRPGSFLESGAGLYYIQDAASLLALAVCQVQPGQAVLDLCAAPGGKATGLLDALAGTGFLLANEPIASRVSLLQHQLWRTGRCNQAVSSLDPQQLADMLPASFDCVLVDAPCSGQSLVGRGQQSRAAFGTKQIEHSAARQRRILQAASALVRPGGRLVYSTCTFATAENEQIIAEFLEDNTHWQPVLLPELDRWASPRVEGCYRLWPHRDRCDGGFAAGLIRQSVGGRLFNCDLSDIGWLCRSKSRSLPGRWTEVKLQNMADQAPWQPWLCTNDDLAEDWIGLQHSGTLHLFSRPYAGLARAALSAVPICSWQVGNSRSTTRVQPEYAGAVVDISGLSAVHRIDLDRSQAARFLAGESLAVGASDELAGWVLVCWQQCPLAWGKISGGIVKNHLPKLFRTTSLN